MFGKDQHLAVTADERAIFHVFLRAIDVHRDAGLRGRRIDQVLTGRIDLAVHAAAEHAVGHGQFLAVEAEVAAAVAGQSLTEFVTTAAVSRAEDTLADRRVFRLDDAAWTEFAAILDRPAKRIPELAELLNDPAPWDT